MSNAHRPIDDRRKLDRYAAERDQIRQLLAARFGPGRPPLAGDPDVEALVEAVAVAIAGIRARLEAEWPLTMRELQAVYDPTHAEVLPSKAIVAVMPDAALTRPVEIVAGTRIVVRPPAGAGGGCEFRTTVRAGIVPACVKSVRYEPSGPTPVLRIRIAVVNPESGVDLADVMPAALRLCLAGDGDDDVRHALFDALLRQPCRAVIRPVAVGMAEPVDAEFRPLGPADLGDDLDDPSVAMGGTILRRLATFHLGSLFVDLVPNGPWPSGTEADVEVNLARPCDLLQRAGAGHVRLNCVPTVNRFERVIDVRSATVRTEHPLRSPDEDTRTVRVREVRMVTRDGVVVIPPASPSAAGGDHPAAAGARVRWHVVWRPIGDEVVPHLVLLGPGYGAAVPRGGVTVRVECARWSGPAAITAGTPASIAGADGRPLRGQLLAPPTSPLAPPSFPDPLTAADWSLGPLAGGARQMERCPSQWLRSALEREARADWDSPPDDGRRDRCRDLSRRCLEAIVGARVSVAEPIDGISEHGLEVAVALNPAALPGRSPMLLANALTEFLVVNAPWGRWVRVTVTTPDGEIRCPPRFHNRQA